MSEKKRVPLKKKTTIRAVVSEPFKEEFLKIAGEINYTESELVRHIALNFILDYKRCKYAEQIEKLKKEQSESEMKK